MEAVRDGGTQREVARRFGVGLATVQLWLDRAGDRPLDAVDWEDRPSVRRRSSRTSEGMEEVVLETRRTRREESVLGEDGAEASARPSRKGGNLPGPLPSTRTIGRILEPRGGGASTLPELQERSAGYIAAAAPATPSASRTPRRGGSWHPGSRSTRGDPRADTSSSSGARPTAAP